VSPAAARTIRTDVRQTPVEALAGVAASVSIFLSVMVALNIDLTISGVHLAFQPVRVGVAAAVLAVLAAWVGGRHARLATFAVFFSATCWVVGMAVAVAFEKPLF